MKLQERHLPGEEDLSAEPRFQLLGPLRVVDGTGREIHPGGFRQKAVLALLLLAPNRVVSTDALAESLWGDRPPATATATLHSYVSRLRKVLEPARKARSEPSVIARYPGGYRLAVGVDELDMSQFKALAARAQASGETDPALARRLLERCLALWRDEPLADFAYEPFAQAAIVWLNEEKLAVTEALHDIRIECGEHHQLVPELRRYVDTYRLRERGWRQLMLALYRSGRQADALRTYQQLVRTLNEELGVDPSPESQRLEHAVLQQDPNLERAQREPPSTQQAPRHHVAADVDARPRSSRRRYQSNLPELADDLIGRQTETTDAATLLLAHRLVTIIGIGGAGKTRLALAVAAQLVSAMEDGVWFVDLAPVDSASRLPEAIAEAAGLRLTAGAGVAQLSAALAGREPLLVLDNCEHLTVGVAGLVESLLASTRARVLVTSREPLGLVNEWQYKVPPLAVSESRSSPAVALLILAAARAGYELRDHEVPLAARVCSRLDGLPLALELAGAQLRSLTMAELEERLEHPFELLARRGLRDRRQSSLLAVLDGSWALLTTIERELLRQLAAFASHFDLGAAEAAARHLPVESVASVLTGLTDRSLLRTAGGTHRLLDTVKMQTQRHWHDRDAAGSYVVRHRDWVLDTITGYAPQDRHTSFQLAVWTASYYDDLRLVEADLSTEERLDALVEVLCAHSFAIGYGTGTRAASLIERLHRYLSAKRFDRLQLGRIHLLTALAGMGAMRPDVMAEHATMATGLLADGSSAADRAMAHVVHALTVADLTSAAAEFEQARQIATAAGDNLVAQCALAFRAITFLVKGHRPEATAAIEELAEELPPDTYSSANSVYLQASVVDSVVDDPERAWQLCNTLLQAQHQLGVPYTEAWQAFHAYTAASAAKTTEAVAAVHSLEGELYRSGGNPDRDVLLPSAVLAWRLGDTERARRWLAAIKCAGPMRRFGYLGLYRQLLAVPELAPRDQPALRPLPGDAAEALAWLDSLT